MQARVSIIMGSTSDLPIMEEAASFLDKMEIPFELKVLSAHRTPEKVEEFSKSSYERGIRVIIAGAGMAAHLPGIIAAFTYLPVIGVPIKSSLSLDGVDSILSMLQMPSGTPVATVGLNSAKNAAIFAAQILAVDDKKILKKLIDYKGNLKEKVIKANNELSKIKYKFKV